MLSVSRTRSVACFLVLLAAVATFPVATSAQLLSPAAPGTVPLSAVKGESFTVTFPGAAISFDLNSSPSAGSSSISITTSWVLNPSRTNVTIVAWFDSTTAALTDGVAPPNGPNNIPSASVQGSVTAVSPTPAPPTAFTPFTGAAPIGNPGASLIVFSEAIGGTNKNKSRVDSLDLRIDQTGLTLPAGTYTGTLKIQGRAI